MALTKAQKQKIIEDLKERILRQKIMIFIDFTSLKVKDLFDLRKKLKKVKSELKVAKKTLVEIAFKEAKLKIEPKKLLGQMALIFGFGEEISPAKVAYQFSQENPNLKILGGFFEGKFKDSEEIIRLAQLPTKDELLARLIKSISFPVSSLVNVLQGNIKGLINIIANLSKCKPNLN